MDILLVAATAPEIGPLQAHLQQHWAVLEENRYQKGEHTVRLLVTGVGTTPTAFALGAVLSTQPPQLAINMGIAGALDASLPLGTVVHVISETFADVGAELADGSFSDLFDLGLLAPNTPPFTSKMLWDTAGSNAGFLPQAHGITVQRVHGSAASIAALRARLPFAQVESMEGAAFFYACLTAEIPFVQVRGISNYVEPRNRENWKIREAITAVNEVVIQMIEQFVGAD